MLSLAKKALVGGLLGILVLGILFVLICFEGYVFMHLYNFAIVRGVFKDGTIFQEIHDIWKGISLYLLITLFFRMKTTIVIYDDVFSLLKKKDKKETEKVS